MRIAIIGAGISGVSLAYLLSLEKKKGISLDITVFDQSDRPGGCIKTLEKDGYLLESGPNGVLNSKAHVKKMLTDGGLSVAVEKSSELTRRRYIQLNNRLHLAPLGPLSAVTSGLLSFSGKLRILKEPFISPKMDDTDESISAFATRRIGEEASRRLVATLVGGVYAGDSDKLSIRSSFPRLYNLERVYGSLLKGMIGKMKESKNKPEPERTPRDKESYKLLSTPKGMQGFVSIFADATEGVEFRYSTKVDGITKNSKSGYTVHSAGTEEHFDIAVLCCNANDGAEIADKLSPELSAAFNKIVFAPVFICGMGIDEKEMTHPMDGFGYLVVPEDKSMVLGCLFSSSLFEGRAPAGKRLLTVITVGDRFRDYFSKSDKELEQIAFESVKNTLGITKPPETTLTFRTEHAMPQYYIGHSAIVAEAERAMENNPGFYIGGNTLYGVSVADCINTSIGIAEKILAHAEK